LFLHLFVKEGITTMGELVGPRLGDYRLSSLAKRGAFVDTYLGVHVRTGATAALKVFRARLSWDEVDIFQHETQRLAELTHPHLVQVLDFDISGELAFLVLDALPDSLQQKYPAGMQLPLVQVIEYAKQLGSALQYAHDQGLVHCDLRPGHLFTRAGDNQLLLSDLGIVSLARAIATSGLSAALATSPYAAPELPGGMMSPACDQYALAVLVYAWLTGELPFQDVSRADFDRQRLLEMLKVKAPDLPTEAGEALTTALSRAPGIRFAGVLAFVTALEQAVSAQAVLLSAPHQTVGAAQPRQGPGAPAASVVPSVLPVQAAGATPTGAGAPVASVVPSVLPVQATGAASAGTGASRRQLLAGLITGGVGLVAIAVTDTVVYSRLNASIAASLGPVSPTLIHTQPKKNKDGSVDSLFWSPDSTRIALLPWYEGNIEIWDATTGHNSATWNFSALQVTSVAWSQHKLLVLTVGGYYKDARIIDAVSKQQILAYTGIEKYGLISAMRWSPDNKRVGIATNAGTIDIWDASTGQDIIHFGIELVPATDGGRPDDDKVVKNASASDLYWSPDGKRIVSLSDSGILYVWDVQSGQQIASYAKHWREHIADAKFYTLYDTVVWSPNSLFIASWIRSGYGEPNDSNVHIWSVLDGSSVSIYSGHRGQGIDRLVWSPDSSMIASVGKDGLVHVWNPTNATRVYIHSDQKGTGLAWAPGGTRIASSGKEGSPTAFQIWNATDGSHVVTYSVTDTERSSFDGGSDIIAWSPDEQLVASVDYDGTTRIWKGGW
jgi:WD40 repeat protein